MNNKKLDSNRDLKSVIDKFAHSVDGVNRIAHFVKNSHRFQKTLETPKNLSQASFGGNGQVNINGDLIRNLILEVTIAAGTYVLPDAWGAKILESIEITEPGASKYRIKGADNILLSFRELERTESINNYLKILGGTVTNPSDPVKCYILINVLHSSVNPQLAQFYPHGRRNSVPISLTFNFNKAEQVFNSGSAALGPVRLITEVGQYENSMSASKSLANETYGYEVTEISSIKLTNSNNLRQVQLPTVAAGEYEELIYTVVLESDFANNNFLYGLPVSNIIARIGSDEIINENNDLHRIKNLIEKNKDFKYTLASAERSLHVLDLAPLPYVKQIAHGILHNGVRLHLDTFAIDFHTPTTTADCRLIIFGVKKLLREFVTNDVKKKYTI